MRRTLKRSRLLGMLAVLLTMSLVTAFGAPAAAVADDDKRGKGKNERGCDSSGSDKKDKRDKARNGDECEETGGLGRSDRQDRGEANASEDNGNPSSPKSAKRSDNSQSDSKSKAKSSSRRDSKRNAKSEKSSGSNNKGGSSNSKSNSRSGSNSGSKGTSGSDNSGSTNGQNNGGGAARSNDNGSDTHPPGNNGTVKIDGTPFGDHPNNEPHPGCMFEVDFYNYDEGDLAASVTFTSHPPTNPSGQVVLSETGIQIGEDAATGGTDLDATRTYTLDLSGFTPHPQQGHHIKLTVNAEGSRGADTKHKVFWVDCVEDSEPDDEVDDEVTEDDDEVKGDREDEVTEESDADVEVEEDSVMGTMIQREADEVAAQQEEQPQTRSLLPFTGAGVIAFFVLALAMIGAGAATLARYRRN